MMTFFLFSSFKHYGHWPVGEKFPVECQLDLLHVLWPKYLVSSTTVPYIQAAILKKKNSVRILNMRTSQRTDRDIRNTWSTIQKGLDMTVNWVLTILRVSLINSNFSWPGEVVQWIRVFVILTENLDLILNPPTSTAHNTL